LASLVYSRCIILRWNRRVKIAWLQSRSTYGRILDQKIFRQNAAGGLKEKLVWEVGVTVAIGRVLIKFWSVFTRLLTKVQYFATPPCHGQILTLGRAYTGATRGRSGSSNYRRSDYIDGPGGINAPPWSLPEGLIFEIITVAFTTALMHRVQHDTPYNLLGQENSQILGISWNASKRPDVSSPCCKTWWQMKSSKRERASCFGFHRDGPWWIKISWVCCFLSKRILSDPTPSRLRRCMATDLPTHRSGLQLQWLEHVQLLSSTSYMSGLDDNAATLPSEIVWRRVGEEMSMGRSM